MKTKTFLKIKFFSNSFLLKLWIKLGDIYHCQFGLTSELSIFNFDPVFIFEQCTVAASRYLILALLFSAKIKKVMKKAFGNVETKKIRHTLAKSREFRKLSFILVLSKTD